MKTADYEAIFKQTQTELAETVYNELKKYYPTDYIKKTDSYIYAIGNIPIALIAHLDTVWEKNPPQFIFHDSEKGVMWNPYGLGADDRAGVIAILNILAQGYVPHVIFTHDEEIGGLGAEELAANGNPFPELKYIIELDRKGSEDCVFYECENKDFQKYVESFGFKTAIGTFSDISYICPTWNVCGVNLSIGYYNEHSATEMFFPKLMQQTIFKVINMLCDKEIPHFKWIGSKVFSVIKSNAKNFETKNQKGTKVCCNCQKSFAPDEILRVNGANGGTKYYCLDCGEKNLAFCIRCGNVYEDNRGINHTGFCPNCYESMEDYYEF